MFTLEKLLIKQETTIEYFILLVTYMQSTLIKFRTWYHYIGSEYDPPLSVHNLLLIKWATQHLFANPFARKNSTSNEYIIKIGNYLV